MKRLNKTLVTYWIKHYVTEDDPGMCSLCGNTGIVDTRSATSPLGLKIGRRNWCICPNGQTMRLVRKTERP